MNELKDKKYIGSGEDVMLETFQALQPQEEAEEKEEEYVVEMVDN